MMRSVTTVASQTRQGELVGTYYTPLSPERFDEILKKVRIHPDTHIGVVD